MFTANRRRTNDAAKLHLVKTLYTYFFASENIAQTLASLFHLTHAAKRKVTTKQKQKMKTFTGPL